MAVPDVGSDGIDRCDTLTRRATAQGRKRKRMRKLKGWKAAAGVVAALSLAVAACGGDDGDSSGGDSGGETPAGECESLTPVKLQLQWFIQAQFAG